MPRNLALTIEYDGTAFHGWQQQAGFRTVEYELQKALEAVTHFPVRLFAASRTDAGVHARGQVASFLTNCKFPTGRIQASLRHILPEDIAVLEIKDKPEEFHARHHAKGKWYRYCVFQRSVPPAMERAYVLAIWEKIRMAPMQKAAQAFLGTHDFSSFGVNSGTEPESTIKTMHRVTITAQENKIFFDIVGDSFLYRMVRSMVGTLLDIGLGKRDAQSIISVLERKHRSAAGFTAAAHGLCLMKVFYADDLTHFLANT